VVDAWAKRRYWSLGKKRFHIRRVGLQNPPHDSRVGVPQQTGTAITRESSPPQAGSRRPPLPRRYNRGILWRGCPSEISIPHSPSARCSAHDTQAP
jgi:hypothetical protein